MRKLVKDLISARISRRGFLAGMAAASYGASAAKSALAAIEPFLPGGKMPEGYVREVTGTGADLLVEQILETGAKYFFVANGTGLGPISDSLVDHPQLQLRQGLGQNRIRHVQSGRFTSCQFKYVQCNEGQDTTGNVE